MNSSDRTTSFLAIALLICTVLAACNRSEGQKGADPSPVGNNSGDIDDLRTLPYTSGTPIEGDEDSGVVIYDPQRSCPGYNLYTVLARSMAELIDEQGKVINFWTDKSSRTWENCELLPNGDLLVVAVESGAWSDGAPAHQIADEARMVLRLGWDGRVKWKRKLLAHHDIELTPSGKLLLLGFERRLVPEIHPTVRVRDDQLMLLDQDGNLLKSHSMLEAVRRNPTVFPLQPVRPDAPCGEPWVDIFHSNSVEWMRHKHLEGKHRIYDPANILVCFRHQDRVAVFDWNRNEVVWSWGQGELSGPHDAQVLENGNILLFDNGLGRGYSRAVELDPLTKQIVWQYKADPPTDFYTASKGSVQRLPNGNTLMAESDKGVAIEVTPDGEVVWKYVCPHLTKKNERAAIVRIKRLPRKRE